MREELPRLEQMVEMLLEEAKAQGASAAEAAVSYSTGLSVTSRMRDVETIEHMRDQGLGITVYFGQRKGSANTSDFSREAVKETVTAACNIARFTNEDECAGLAKAELLATSIPDLDLHHPWGLTAEDAIAMGIACEAAALDLDRRVTNSEGASVESHEGIHVYGNTHGFLAGYPSSRHSISCSVIGGSGEGMQRDFWYTVARDPSAMESPRSVGRRAGERTVARLGARKIPTCQAPVIFQAEMATSLMRSFTRAISGSSLYRKASFLLDSLGQRIFPEFVQIGEDPLLTKGLGSAPFDHEGVATKAKRLVTDGILDSYLLDSYSGRKLGMESTGNAGGARNLWIQPGPSGLEELLRTMHRGLLVTEMMGQGLNMVTGDYSRGASGFWVENGEIQFPVEEITIAGNLREMFSALQAVGSDEDCRGNVRTGSWLIESMTIAGN